MATLHPNDLPPSYEQATAGSSSQSNSRPPSRLSTNGPPENVERNGIPADRRRSMEDENRPLPPGWVRSFDPVENHQFFVDTTKDPPRSIWVHPYDDPDFLATLPPEERKKHTRMHRSATLQDITTEDTDNEDEHHVPNPKDRPTGIHKFGRKMKDKLTGSTHEQREQERKRRAEQERAAYMVHLRARQAMIRAMETGQPQFLAKDRDGRDVYIVPPGYGRQLPGNGFGINPFGGPYAMNRGYARPMGPYQRPYGYGYGGGLGAPIAAGFLGGALLGGLMF